MNTKNYNLKNEVPYNFNHFYSGLTNFLTIYLLSTKFILDCIRLNAYSTR